MKRARLFAVGALAVVVATTLAANYALRRLPRETIHDVLPATILTPTVEKWIAPQTKRVAVTNPVARKIVAAAHAQEGDLYDAAYCTISYPGGDVPQGRGACTDVVIRSLRAAGYDLQKLVHQDMKRDFKRYGDSWKLGRTDTNIDHRRVPNLRKFFDKYGRTLPLETGGANLKTWQPGDIVFWRLDGGRWHTGIVSDGVGARGLPLVIHNAMRCTEQDYLDAWPIVGHYRFPK